MSRIEDILRLIADHETFDSDHGDFLSTLVHDILKNYPSDDEVGDALDEDELDQVIAARKDSYTNSRKR